MAYYIQVVALTLLKTARIQKISSSFSRDSTRVGAALTFDGKLNNGEWHPNGLSSRGDSIYEVGVV